MNIVTYNVRGLGRGVKWAAIRRLIKKENVDISFCVNFMMLVYFISPN